MKHVTFASGYPYQHTFTGFSRPTTGNISLPNRLIFDPGLSGL